MFTIRGGRGNYCDGVSRRKFLQIGAAGVGGLTLSTLLRADEAGLKDPTYRKKSIINVYLGGGPSHLDTFDMKPEAAKEFRGDFQAIDTNVAGIQICEHLPRLAQMMDKMAILRSLTGIHEEHSPHQTETGWSEQSLRNSGGRPSLGAIVSRLHGANNGSAPTFVDLTGHTKYGFLGSVYSAFRPDGEGRANLSLNGVTTGRLDDRQQLLSGLDRLKRDADASGSMKAMDSFAQRAVSVITSGDVARALDLTQEDPRLRQRYLSGGGTNPYTENDRFLAARRLIGAGVRCVSLAWGGWDTHGNNFGHLKMQLPPMDQGLATLIEDLDAHGQLKDTIVIVWGEFGRTPRVNPGAGRDHWPRAMSVLVAGGGLQTGQVVGATNRNGEMPIDRPVHLQEVFSMLYQHMGIDPKYTTLVDNSGRPQYLVEHNTGVKELFA